MRPAHHGVECSLALPKQALIASSQDDQLTVNGRLLAARHRSLQAQVQQGGVRRVQLAGA
jgi:hypothetical protein